MEIGFQVMFIIISLIGLWYSFSAFIRMMFRYYGLRSDIKSLRNRIEREERLIKSLKGDVYEC